MTIDKDGNIVSGIIKPRQWDLVYAVKYCHYIIPQPSSFIKRSILEKVGWLDQEFRNGKDHELWLRIGLAGGKFKYIPVCFSYVRNTPGLSQQLTIAESKVNLTKKFFNTPNLPAIFNSRRFQLQALSNAYLTASVYILDSRTGKRLGLFLAYLFKAFFIFPLNMNIPFNLLRLIIKKVLLYRLKNLYKRLYYAVSNFTKI